MEEKSIKEMMEIHRKMYEQSVKPYITKGEYEIAHIEMYSLVLSILDERDRILRYVHCGFGYIQFAKVLLEKLETAKSASDLQGVIEKFESYAAQTKLPRLDRIT